MVRLPHKINQLCQRDRQIYKKHCSHFIPTLSARTPECKDLIQQLTTVLTGQLGALFNLTEIIRRNRLLILSSHTVKYTLAYITRDIFLIV